MLHVLVISGGGFQGTTLIKGLLKSDAIVIHLADIYIDNINKYNVEKFHHVPPVKEEKRFTNALIQIVEKENIQVIFPSTDYEISLLAKIQKPLESRGTKIAVSCYELVDVLRDKIKTHDLLIKNEFSVLDRIDIDNGEIDFPIIGKPAIGFGGKNICIVSNQEEFRKINNRNVRFEYLWQKCVNQFDEYSIDFAIDFNDNISELIMRKRIRTSGGFAVIADASHNRVILDEAQRLAQMIRDKGGKGIFNLQVLCTVDGQFYFSDVNPRVGTSSIFSLGMRYNLPLFVCESLSLSAGQKSIKSIPRQSIRMVRNLTEKWINVVSKNRIKGLVFDLDDTIIHHKKWIMDKLHLVFSEYKNKLPAKDDFMLTAYSLIEENKQKRLIDELDMVFSFQEGLRDDMIRSYRAANPDKITVYRDVLLNLKKFKKAGFRLAILTDNPVASQKQKLLKIDFCELFDHIIFSREIGTEKPDVKAFNLAAQRLSIPNENLAMVGDNLYRDCYGAIQAHYGVSYFINRGNTLYNFDIDAFFELTGLSYDKIIEISSMNDIVIQ